MPNHNRTKKYALFSLALNLALLLLYSGCYHHKKQFSAHDGIKKTLHFSQQVLGENSDRIYEDVLEPLSRKPKLATTVLRQLDTNKILSDDFSCWVDSLFNKEVISSDMMRSVKIEYDVLMKHFLVSYRENLKASQKEAKMTNEEVKEKIENFENYISEMISFDSIALNGISENEKKLLLTTMVNDVRLVQLEANGYFIRMASWRGCFWFPRYFPVVLSSKNEIKKGDYFEAEISVGTFGRVDILSKYITGVYLDDEKIDLNGDWRYPIVFNTSSLGKKNYSIVLNRMDKNFDKHLRDTTWFDYNVVQ